MEEKGRDRCLIFFSPVSALEVGEGSTLAAKLHQHARMLIMP